jgi:transposase-like protein
MLDKDKESYSQLFQSLLDRGLKTPLLVVSDANKGLIAAIRESFPGASWQRLNKEIRRRISVAGIFPVMRSLIYFSEFQNRNRLLTLFGLM